MLLPVITITGMSGDENRLTQVMLNPETIGLVEPGPNEEIDGKQVETCWLYVDGRDVPLKFPGTVEQFESQLMDALCEPEDSTAES